jgi:tetratricopeptide (TPR) repeat protein
LHVGTATQPTNAEWESVLDALNRYDFVAARSHLEQCLKLWPLHAEAHFQMARVARRLGDTDTWQIHLRQAAALQWPADQITLETVLMTAQSGDLAAAEPALRKAGPIGNEELILEALTKGYLEAQRSEDALALTNAWVERFPADALPLLYRARTCYVNRLLSQAIDDYNRALLLQPDFLEAHLQLAGVLMVQSQFGPALEHYQLCLKGRPNDATALIGAANCQLALGDTAAARKTLEALFAQYPKTLAGCLLRAKMETADDKPAEALAWLKRAEAQSPHEVDVLYQFALVLRSLHRNVEAEQYERQLARLRADIQRFDALRRQVKQEPDKVALRYEAGKLALAMGREAEAARWFRGVLQIDPNHGPTHQLLADYYRRQGDAQRAEQHERRLRKE